MSMKGLLEALDTVGNELSASPTDSTPKEKTGRADLYKMKTSKADQESRRRELLQQQKQKRWDMVKYIRQLTEEADDVKGETEALGEDTSEKHEEMEVQTTSQRHMRYRNHLMQSEWMMEAPEDLEEKWFVVPCPTGSRRLVAAAGGHTKVYNKNGYLDRRFHRQGFRSLLPGGNLADHRGGYTLLDCVFDGHQKTFYILDLMAWNVQIFYDAETDFRFYWLHQKMSEMPEVMECKERVNTYQFIPLPNFPCTSHGIHQALSVNFKIDGLLFFHKHTHYTLGPTPLVLWLKPFMVPEVLGIPVSVLLMETRPASYTTFQEYIKSGSWQKPRSGKRNKNAACDSSMEVVDCANADSSPCSPASCLPMDSHAESRSPNLVT